MEIQVKPNELTAEIQRILREAGSSVETAYDRTIVALAKETALELRQTSPKRKGGGSYAKSWNAKKTKTGVVVYSKDPHYRLTHLIENGHVTRHSTGKYGKITFTKGNPHIANAEKHMYERFDAEFERQLDLQMRKI